MPWSGGSFTRANGDNGWTNDANLGIGIEAGLHDTQDNDFKNGINQCLNKDGSNSATGNLNLGGYLPTNIGAGTAAAPAICAGNDVNTGIFSAGADQIGIATNGTEKYRFTNDGILRGASNALVEVNRANATAATSGGCYKLQIDGTNHVAIATSGSEACTIYTGVGTLSQRIRFAANDFAIFNFGTGAGTHTMKYNSGTGAWTYDTSSLRYKKDVVDSVYGLEAVLKLRSTQFKYKDDNRPDVGFIAEEVAKVIPELAPLDMDGAPISVSYDRLTSVLCKAIQELNAKVEALEARVAELEP